MHNKQRTQTTCQSQGKLISDGRRLSSIDQAKGPMDSRGRRDRNPSYKYAPAPHIQVSCMPALLSYSHINAIGGCRVGRTYQRARSEEVECYRGQPAWKNPQAVQRKVCGSFAINIFPSLRFCFIFRCILFFSQVDQPP